MKPELNLKELLKGIHCENAHMTSQVNGYQVMVQNVGYCL